MFGIVNSGFDSESCSFGNIIIVFTDWVAAVASNKNNDSF